MQKNKYNQINIDGILLLDKPISITSNDALQRVKRLYKARKAGHTGSLDPLASGMLPICFGEATKFAQFLLDTDKKYQVTAQLGTKTTTGDAEGEILIQKSVPILKESQIEEVLARFRGKIEQIPSMYSALKHNGQPLYKLARAGISVTREKRPVTIYSLELINKTDTQLEMTVHCSKGTYVRTLVEDIGEALGCEAHVIALRRLTVGKYQENQMVTLTTVEQLAKEENYDGLKELLLPMESMVAHWPLVQVTEAIAYFMHQGNPVIIPQAPTQGWLRLQSKNGNFLGVGEVLPDGKVAPRRLIK